MIVATAGHIDHGKTTLVKALTGVDTDRLPQEKARGISIDLGFAYCTLQNGATIGFVDVPGHERFVRNMLAGVCAVDHALLVVAADDGVMPQTREHLHIIDLLAIADGTVAITKADRVDAGRVAAVQAEVADLLADTTLAAVEQIAVSATTGAGIDALRARLATVAERHRRQAVTGRRPRYAVDRVFTRAGSGTVVTGTVFDGAVNTGDRLIVSPDGHEVRVRAIQKQGASADRAEAGERCAINLAGIERSQVQRGAWVLHPEMHAPATRIDVQLRVLADEGQPLRHWTPVHLHLGTGSVMARLSLRRGESVAPGQEAFARLVVDAPLVAAHGDRFILRDASAQRTLGGGVVLDAQPPQRRLPPAAWVRRLQALLAPRPADTLAQWVAASPAGVPAEAFRRNFKLDPDGFSQVLQQAGATMVGSGAQAVVLSRAAAQARLLRRTPAPEQHNPEHTRLWQQASSPLAAAGRAGITVADLARTLRAKEPVLRDALHQHLKRGDVVKVGDERFYLRVTIDEFIAVARTVAAAQPDGRFTLAQFRDAASIGRALAAQVLDAIDRLGITQRVADARVFRHPPAATPTRLRIERETQP